MMAIAMQLDFVGGTLANYDKVIKKMDFRPQGAGAPGLLFHWAAKTADGIRVTDVWTDRAVAERFAQEKIGPLTQEFGLPPPVTQFVEVHNYLTAG